MALLFIISLTFCVFTASNAFNLDKTGSVWKYILYVFVLSAMQGLMYWLGSLLGGTFMHMFEKYSKIIVMIICFMIAYRMMTDTLKIKNGKKLFFIDKPQQLIILSVAVGINPFIAGLIAHEPYLPLVTMTNCDVSPFVMAGSAFIWGLIAVIMKFSQIKLLINSLLNVVAALAILAVGFVAVF